eukprot:Gb_38779 [translate_table: standard]
MTTTTMKNSNITRFLLKTIGRFTEQVIVNNEQRLQQREQFAERIARQNGEEGDQVQYAEQAVIANLDWGTDALEEAIQTTSMETKTARLEHAEKMLQVCALLNPEHTTAGVPNSYLSAWAHLNLALVSKLRKNDRNAAVKAVEMFMVDPLNSRLEFSPGLWEDLFLVHLTPIVEWYTEHRNIVLSTVLPDSSDVTISTDMLAFDETACRNLLSKMSAEQTKQLQALEKMYQESLDENTIILAQYYREWLDLDPSVKVKRMPAVPVVETPMFPQQFGSPPWKICGFTETNSGFGNGLRIGRIDEAEFRNGRYNPMWEDYDDQSRDNSVSMISGIPKWSARSMPQRVLLEDVMTPEEKSNPEDTFHQGGPSSSGFNYSSEDSSSLLESGAQIQEENQDKFDTSSNRSTAIWDSKEERQQNEVRIEDTEPEYEFATFVTGNEDNTSRHGFSCILNCSPMPMFSPMVESEEDVIQSSYQFHSSGTSTPQQRPPKDFVCPITGQLFNDPVTLETGQTYERRAIQEWLDRGNTTCPITRQNLTNSVLPKPNYVLKRLIASWKEQNPQLAVEFASTETPRPETPPASSRQSETSSIGSDSQSNPNYSETRSSSKNRRFSRISLDINNSSPTSVISQAALESMIGELRPAISCLCTSEDLEECESAVLTISHIWQSTKAEPSIQAHLVKPAVINGFVEILSNSITVQVLRATVYILSELVATDEMVMQTLTRVGSDLEVLVALLKKGLWEAAVLIYQLKPSISNLASLDLIPALIQVIKESKDETLALEGYYQMQLRPKEVATVMMERILAGEDDNCRSVNALSIISMNGLPALVGSLESKNLEERFCAVSILLCCIQADGRCRDLIAHRAELAPILEIFHTGNDRERFITINFISELIRLNRRTFNDQVLQIIKDEGTVSTMHMLLVHLQMASLEQRPIVASLLLQLDLLAEPRKMSMYREEAIEALVEGLKAKEFLTHQLTAAETIIALEGRFSSSGKPLTEALLLKHAGFDQSYNALMKADKLPNPVEESPETLEEEEKAAKDWERRVAFVLVSYEFGLVFEALGEGLKSNSVQLSRLCLISATWLTHMLTVLPDTGLRGAARQCLLEQFVRVLQSSKNFEERALAMLALSSFINDSEGLEELEIHVKGIFKPLRELKKSSAAAADMLRALVNQPSVNVSELWNYAEISQKDSSMNGEMHSLVHSRDRIFSGHSDGTLKVWDGRKRILHLIQEVREHTKSVTSLAVSPSGDKLYSGSLDKTVKVWAIGPEEIHCIQVHDMKDHVNALNVTSSMACFVPQGTGIKIHNWNGSSKLLNPNKHARCLSMVEGKIYCGCTDNSIQEIDVGSGTSNTIQPGVRKLLGKMNPIYALKVFDGFLYVASTPVDGAAVKVWSLSTNNVVGYVPTTVEVRSMAVNNEFIYLGSKFGTIEVWLRERLIRVGTLYTKGGSSKVVSLAVDMDGEILFSGSVDGKIQSVRGVNEGRVALIYSPHPSSVRRAWGRERNKARGTGEGAPAGKGADVGGAAGEGAGEGRWRERGWGWSRRRNSGGRRRGGAGGGKSNNPWQFFAKGAD